MKKDEFVITIPRHCTENWMEMTPVDKGRFCSSCQKTVTDFRTLSNREIIDFFKTSKGASLCGRFNTEQLNRAYSENKPSNSFSTILLQKIAASILFFQAVNTTVRAQAIKPVAVQQQNEWVGNDSVKRRLSFIKGCVTNKETPLPDVTVQIKGTEIKTRTNQVGDFYLPLPDNFIQDKFILTAYYADTLINHPGKMTFVDREMNSNSLLFDNNVNMYGNLVDDDMALVGCVSVSYRYHWFWPFRRGWWRWAKRTI